MSKIASVAGKPLHTDECTITQSEVSFARALVEVDISQPLIRFVRLKRPDGKVFEQKLEYEWEPVFCQQCQKVGHIYDVAPVPPVRAKPHQGNLRARQWPNAANGQWRVIGRRQAPVTTAIPPVAQPIPQTEHANQFEVLNDNDLPDQLVFLFCWKIFKGSSRLFKVTYPMIISTWNVRGMNKSLRQREVIKFIRDNDVGILGLLETRIKQPKADSIRRQFGMHWSFADNYGEASNGRIWVAWNGTVVQFQVISSTPQCIHGYLKRSDGSFSTFSTFVYALDERDALWTEIRRLHSMTYEAWIVVGDFNNVLYSTDRVRGLPVCDSKCENFRNVLMDAQLQDVVYTG